MHDSVSYMSSCIHIYIYIILCILFIKKNIYMYIRIRAIMIVYFPKGPHTASIIIFPKKSLSPRPPRHRGNECHSLGARRGSSAEMDPVFWSQQTQCNATDSLDGALQMKETSLLFLKLQQHPLKILTVYIPLIYVVLVVLLYCCIVKYHIDSYRIISHHRIILLYYWHCILKVGTVMTLKPEKMPMSPVDFLNSACHIVLDLGRNLSTKAICLWCLKNFHDFFFDASS